MTKNVFNVVSEVHPITCFHPLQYIVQILKTGGK